MAASSPNLVLLNGKIATMSAAQPSDVEALAVSGSRITQLGSSETIRALAGPQTTIVDLKGQRVIPGLIDGHCHAVKGVVARRGGFTFRLAGTTPTDILDSLNEFMDKFPDVEFVIGGRYSSEFLAQYAEELVPTPREWLDGHSRGRAVYLRDDSGHNGFANTRALKYLGFFGEDAPDFGSSGTIVKDRTTGIPNGVLLEEADIKARGI
jgi:predicted amidohydrolase YtcJ